MNIIIDVLPPSVNNYWGYSLKGYVYRKVEAKQWLTYASSIIRNKKKSMYTTAVEIGITVNYSKLNRDLDNMLKAILDCLQYAGIIKNDNMKYVEAIHIFKGERVDKGKENIEIEIYEIEK